MSRGVSASAHAETYLQLAEGTVEGPSNVTFVAGRGLVEFPETTRTHVIRWVRLRVVGVESSVMHRAGRCGLRVLNGRADVANCTLQWARIAAISQIAKLNLRNVTYPRPRSCCRRIVRTRHWRRHNLRTVVYRIISQASVCNAMWCACA